VLIVNLVQSICVVLKKNLGMSNYRQSSGESMSKGSVQRPKKISPQKFSENWDKIFKKPQKKDLEKKKEVK
jgi:hypothetical protein